MRSNGDMPPHHVLIDIPYDRRASMDEVLTHMIHTPPVDYGVMADINCPVPASIMSAFKYKCWDWSLAVWMYGGGTMAPHKDKGSKVDGNEVRVATDTQARTAALWFPLYGDYDRSPIGIHEMFGPNEGDIRRVADLMLDRTILVDMGDYYMHSMDNGNGHIFWYCLNFDYPETLDGALQRIRAALL